MANPKQFVRSKSHRQFFGFYLMNWSTWQLKGKPYHLKEKLKPCVAVSLEAAARWCWVPVPTLLLELPSWPGCAKDIPKRVVWPESYSTCWRIPKWKSLHEYSILCNLDFCSIFCYKEMFSSSSPYSCGGQDWHPTTTGFPKSSRKDWWPYCLLTIKFLLSRVHTSCSDLLEGDKLSRKVRFPLASLSWKLSVDPSEGSL